MARIATELEFWSAAGRTDSRWRQKKLHSSRKKFGYFRWNLNHRTMGILNKLFGSSKASSNSQPDTPTPSASFNSSDFPIGADDFDSLTREEIAYGGKRLSRRYWNSIYLGAYAPQLDTAIFKGTKLDDSDAERIVKELHVLFGEDDIGNTDWTDADSTDLSGDVLNRSWTVQPEDVRVDLNVDNFSPNDDPVMLSITPWKVFRTVLHNKRKSTL